MENLTTIGERVKDLRKRTGLTQKQFGSNIGVTDAHISKIEAGKDVPSKALIWLMADKYRVETNWLSSGFGDPYRNVMGSTMLSQNVNDLLDEYGINEEKLLLDTGIEKINFVFLMNGLSDTDVRRIAILAEYFAVSIDYLLGIADSNTVYRNEAKESLSPHQKRILTIYNNATSQDKELIIELLKKFEA